MLLSKFIKILLRPRGKSSFILYAKKLNKQIFLDVGCGNNSWKDFLYLYPQCNYVGLDIQRSKNMNPGFGREVIVDRKDFNTYLGQISNSIDVVFSAHNLEHCDDYKLTLKLLKKAISLNGLIYLSFPTKKSINFPKRSGALNYYSDSTHISIPPDFDYVIDELNNDGFEVIYSSQQYRPFLLFIFGLIQEPASYLLNKNLRFTWGLYGFESIIWAKRVS